jgi:hypothetical protein
MSNDPNDTISQLKDEIWSLRNDMIDLMPAALAEKLHGYRDCENSDAFEKWLHATIAEIAEATVPVPEWSHSGDRGRCPLCRAMGSSFNRDGYLIPDGIAQHLGSHGNVTPCPVMDAARDLARDHMQPIRQAERQAESDRKAERRKTEQLYLTEPGRPPELIDETYFSSLVQGRRDAEQMAFAEARLHTLKFEIETNGNVVTYKLPHPDFLILADPRDGRQITFHVSERQWAEAKQTMAWAKRRHRFTASFKLSDALKNNIGVKFQALLDAACAEIHERGNSTKGKKAAMAGRMA